MELFLFWYSNFSELLTQRSIAGDLELYSKKIWAASRCGLVKFLGHGTTQSLAGKSSKFVVRPTGFYVMRFSSSIHSRQESNSFSLSESESMKMVEELSTGRYYVLRARAAEDVQKSKKSLLLLKTMIQKYLRS